MAVRFCDSAASEVTVQGVRYHHLADGRGWVFERKDGILATVDVRAVCSR